MNRSMTWITHAGWACSKCAWTYPIPTLLSDPAAKEAYDRLASGTFQRHDCTQHPTSGKVSDDLTFLERMRQLVRRGFKPKDAAEPVLQEVLLESQQPRAFETGTG